MNKRILVKKIVAKLTAELAVYHKAARAAHAEATHEQSKAENKYDTRGLEASYLARGQSQQAAEIVQSIERFEKLSLQDFAKGQLIDLGALVELEAKNERTYYFIGPSAGGTEILHEKKGVLVITPQSPFGQQIMRKRSGEKLQITIGPARTDYKIVSVY